MPIVRSAHPEYPGAESPPSGASTTGIQPDPDVDAVLDGVPIGIFSLDHEFRITRVNSLAELFMRKPRQEVLGKNIWDEFPGAVGTPFHRAGLKAMAEQVTVELEEFYPPFNLWLEVQARPSDEGLNIYVRDISERRLAEDALRERQWELQAILDSTADGILVVDNEGKISYGNQRFAYMWRIPADVLATQSDDQLLAFVLDQLSDPEQFLSKVRELYRTSREDFDSISFRDGRVFERYSRPLLRGHEPAGRVWSFRDVTRRTRVEAQLRLTHELAMAIGSAATVQEAVGIALTKVCEATGWVLGQAWFPSADGTHLECGSTWYAGAEGLGPFRAMSAATTFSPGVGLPGRVWASKERVWVT
ncbi:MAG TPA: PAS domain-containing protein, partial [Actinomycetota bacterium]